MIFYILGAKQFESLQDHRNVLRQWPLPQCLQRRYAKLAQQLCHLASNRFKYIGWLHMVYTKNTLQHIYSNNNNCRCISLLAERRIFFSALPPGKDHGFIVAYRDIWDCCVFTFPSHVHRLWKDTLEFFIGQNHHVKFVQGKFQHTGLRIIYECASYRLTPKQVLSHTWSFAGFLLSVSALKLIKLKYESPTSWSFWSFCWAWQTFPQVSQP